MDCGHGLCLTLPNAFTHLTWRVPGELRSPEAGVHVLADERQSCDKMERAHHMKLLPVLPPLVLHYRLHALRHSATSTHRHLGKHATLHAYLRGTSVPCRCERQGDGWGNQGREDGSQYSGCSECYRSYVNNRHAHTRPH